MPRSGVGGSGEELPGIRGVVHVLKAKARSELLRGAFDGPRPLAHTP